MTAIKVGPLRLYPSNLCPDPAYRALIMSLNPAAYWPMDDLAGSLLDASGNAKHASLAGGGTSITYREDGIQGSPCDYAIDLTGDFLTTGITIGTNQHYACLISVRPDTSMTDNAVLATWASTGMMLYLTTTNSVRVYHNSTGHNPGVTLTTGDWVHLLWGWNGSTVYLWVNGVPMLSAGAGSGAGTGTTMFVGTYDSRTISTWNGRMQHGAVFLDGDADAILTDAEAALLSNAAFGI